MALKTTLKNPLVLVVRLACRRIKIPAVMIATLLILSVLSVHIILSVLTAMASSTPAGSQQQDKVTMAWNSYSQAFKNPIKVGTTLTFENHDIVPHTVTPKDIGTRIPSCSIKASFPCDTGVILPGQEKLITFDKPGIFKYFCEIHPSMEGQIEVII